MDYIYGKLNKEVEQVTYSGGTTSSATVNIDHKTNTIYVDTQSSVVDEYLDLDSSNAVQNKVITKKVGDIESKFDSLSEDVANRLMAYSSTISNVSNSVNAVSNNFKKVTSQTASDIASLSETVAVHDAVIEELKNSGSSANLESKVEGIDFNLAVFKDTTNKSIQHLINEDGLIKSQIVALESTLSDEQLIRLAAINGLQDSLATMREDVSELTDMLDDMDAASAEQVSELQALLTEKIDRLEKLISDLSANYTQIDNTLRSELDNLQTKDNQLAILIEELSNDTYTQLNEKIAILQDNVGDVDRRNYGSIVHQINELHGHIVIAQYQLEEINATVATEVRKCVDAIKDEGLYVVKVTPEADITSVYGATSEGDVQIEVTVQHKKDTLVKRNENGNISLNLEGTFNYDEAVPKAYIDNAIKDSCDKLKGSLTTAMSDKFSIIDGGTAADLRPVKETLWQNRCM